MNYDYKIWAKAISNRLDEVTKDLIGPQQCGFRPGRSTANNIMRTDEVISYLKGHNNAGIIVNIDFEKCFDRVKYEAIEGAFKYFNFGPQFIKMLFLLYTKFEVCTINNGHISPYFVKTRSVNQ